jgi:hypothetical protein
MRSLLCQSAGQTKTCVSLLTTACCACTPREPVLNVSQERLPAILRSRTTTISTDRPVSLLPALLGVPWDIEQRTEPRQLSA